MIPMIPMKTRQTTTVKNNAVVLHAPEGKGSFNIPLYISFLAYSCVCACIMTDVLTW